MWGLGKNAGGSPSDTGSAAAASAPLMDEQHGAQQGYGTNGYGAGERGDDVEAARRDPEPGEVFNPYAEGVVAQRHPVATKVIYVTEKHGIKNILMPAMIMAAAFLYDFYLQYRKVATDPRFADALESPNYPAWVYTTSGAISIIAAFAFLGAKVAEHGSAVRQARYNLDTALRAKEVIPSGSKKLEKTIANRLDQLGDLITTSFLIASGCYAASRNPNQALGFMCAAAVAKGVQFGLRGELGVERYKQITGRNYSAQFTKAQKRMQYLTYALILGAIVAGVETIRHASNQANQHAQSGNHNDTSGSAFHSGWGIATVTQVSLALYLFFMPYMMRGTDAFETAVDRRHIGSALQINHSEGWFARRDVKQELTFLTLQVLLAGGIALGTLSQQFTVVPAVGAAIVSALVLTQLAQWVAQDDQRIANMVGQANSTFKTRDAYLGGDLDAGESQLTPEDQDGGWLMKTPCAR